MKEMCGLRAHGLFSRKSGGARGLAGWVTVLLIVLLPGGLAAQIPGGRSHNFRGERARFLAAALGQIRPVMDSWAAGWRAEGSPPVEDLYAPDAVVGVQDYFLGGEQALADFTRTVRDRAGALVPSMLDFDASDGLAYVYGTWSASSPQAGTHIGRRLVTVLRKDEGGWAIRFQMFGADSASAELFGAVEPTEPWPSLERRVAVGSRAFIPSMPGDRERQDRRSVKRIATYHEVIRALASVRTAWNAGDTDAFAELLREGAMVHPPGGGTWPGTSRPAELKKVLDGYGRLYTVELDFECSGTMTYLSGRYFTETDSGPPLSGNYVAVFQNLGSDWQIRSLLFL